MLLLERMKPVKKSKNRSRSEWMQLIEEWEGSGERQKDFALRRGINPKTFGWHLWQVR